MSLRRSTSTAAVALAVGLLAAGNSGTALADTQEEPIPREPAQESGQEAAQEGGEDTAQEESTTVTYGPWTIPAAEGDHKGEDCPGEDDGHEHGEEGDVLETSARYVVEDHSHTGVMGILVGYLAED